METLAVRPLERLHGTYEVPGDKSVTHRAYLLGALAAGVTTVRNPNSGHDCEASLKAVQALGARVVRPGDGSVQVHGTGGALGEPDGVVDCGNSGTTLRLLAGLAAPLSGLVVLSGDASLRCRPMRRIIEPLGRMGVEFWYRGDGLAPLCMRGGGLHGITYQLPVASAQVKSAVLLAGLGARGATTIIEPQMSRDHTERMLQRFGATLAIEPGPPRRLQVEGGAALAGAEVLVPGDPSAAAFFLVAGLILPDAEVRIDAVGLNPTRRGMIDALIEMGGEIEVRGATESPGGEPVGTVVARSSRLRPITLAGERIPALIDELPIFAVAAAFAGGRSEVRDAGELRVKESDRIELICRNLAACGVRVEERADGFVVHGGPRPHGAEVDACGDHRIAMSMTVLGLAASTALRIRGASNIATSFPGFVEQLEVAEAVR